MSDPFDNGYNSQDDSADLLGGSGGNAASFDSVGDSITGVVLRVKKSVDTYDGLTVTWPNGDPKHVFIFTLDVDGQETAVFCRGNMVKAVREAAQAAGHPATLVGLKMTVQHHALGEKKPGKFPAKLFRAKFEPAPVRASAATPAAAPAEEPW